MSGLDLAAHDPPVVHHLLAGRRPLERATLRADERLQAGAGRPLRCPKRVPEAAASTGRVRDGIEGVCRTDAFPSEFIREAGRRCSSASRRRTSGSG